MKVKKVVIVGGGSSGWMTAAAICKQLPEIELTLIESPNIPIIGVGESTIGHINEFLNLLGLKDEDWMPHCNGTYKTSIKFIDFRENPKEEPHKFHYPFGLFDFTDKPRAIMDWFLNKVHNKEIDNSNFAEFFHDSILMTDKNKLTKNNDGKIRGFDFRTDTAYHMDATLFGVYLRDHLCIPNGMTHILDNVTGYSKDSNGYITHIMTENSGNLEADLFVDCTGFKSLLLEQAMGVEFISFHDTLLNDRAIATVIPYIDKEKEMENYTSCTAIEAGWVWNIPLWNRIGTGYVYSSKFANEQEAEEQFRKHLASNRMLFPDAERASKAEFRHIKIKHGVHKRAWEKNVIGVGLSNGFIEPLESTGLMLTHECITKVVSLLKMRNQTVTKFDIDMFNYAFLEQILGFKEFISQHYALSMRDDTPYWKHVTENINYSESMNNFESVILGSNQDLASRLHRSRVFDNYSMSGIIYIAAGMGYNPVDSGKIDYQNLKYNETNDSHKEVYDTWLEHKKEVLDHIDTLETHYKFLERTIHINSK
jgi:tryptophan halogenase